MSPEQCKAGRALVGMTQQKLATEAGVTRGTIENFERGKTRPQRATILELKDAFERAGVIITFDGVRAANTADWLRAWNGE